LYEDFVGGTKIIKTKALVEPYQDMQDGRNQTISVPKTDLAQKFSYSPLYNLVAVDPVGFAAAYWTCNTTLSENIYRKIKVCRKNNDVIENFTLEVPFLEETYDFRAETGQLSKDKNHVLLVAIRGNTVVAFTTGKKILKWSLINRQEDKEIEINQEECLSDVEVRLVEQAGLIEEVDKGQEIQKQNGRVLRRRSKTFSGRDLAFIQDLPVETVMQPQLEAVAEQEEKSKVSEVKLRRASDSFSRRSRSHSSSPRKTGKLALPAESASHASQTDIVEPSCPDSPQGDKKKRSPRRVTIQLLKTVVKGPKDMSPSRDSSSPSLSPHAIESVAIVQQDESGDLRSSLGQSKDLLTGSLPGTDSKVRTMTDNEKEQRKHITKTV
jgi:hypothetical protein